MPETTTPWTHWKERGHCVQRLYRSAVWLCLFSLLLGGSVGIADVTAAPAQAKEKKRHTIYVFRDGSLIGLSLHFATPHPIELMINAAHTLQWLRCRVGRITLIILPQGGVMIQKVLPGKGFELKFNEQGRLEALGQVKITYDLNGRVNQIGAITFGYDPHGRLFQWGSHTLQYRNDRKVEAVGTLKLSYRAEGRIDSLGSLAFKYRADGKIESIGKLQFEYDPLRGILYKSNGHETRAKIQVHWSTLDIYRILRRK